MASEELTAAIRRQVEGLIRPGQRGGATVPDRTPASSLQRAAGGTFQRRYDWASEEELTGALYGRSRYGRARYRSVAS